MAHGIQNKTSTCYISYWHIYPKCRNIWFTIERNEKIQVWKARVRKKEIFLPRIRFGLNIGHRAVKLHKAAKRVPFRIHRFNQIMLVRAALWSMEVETKRTKPLKKILNLGIFFYAWKKYHEEESKFASTVYVHADHWKRMPAYQAAVITGG